MKFVIVFAALFAIAFAVDPQQAETLRLENDNIGLGSYNWLLETSDGKSAQEQGELKNVGAENEGISVHGSFSYTAPDGQVITVNYVADENGFQPEGAHLPVAPSA